MSGSTGLGAVIDDARVIVSVGPGGVGKTSTSAAVALEAARRGKRVAVLTIDPARRLANALGLAEIGSEERRIDVAAFTAAGLEAPRGVMTAMMLDVHRMWDDTVRRHHPDPERRERLLNNRMYQTLSSTLAGSQEYMAMEKLHELASRTTDPLDLIVLDTPPATHAVDFLEAPTKLLDALDNEATRWLIEPFRARGKVSARLFDAGGSFVIRTLGRFTGVETLEALADLLSGFQDMFDGFKSRARAVNALLGDARTAFVIVAAPRPGPVSDARAFYTRLKADQIRVAGFVLNRATVDPFGAAGSPLAGSPQALGLALAAVGAAPDLAGRIEALVDEQRSAVGAEHKLAESLSHMGAPVWMVPELRRDVHDLSGLDALRSHLFA